MPVPLSRVATFWMGSELSFMEIASLLSVMRVGHAVDLYSYEKPSQLPSGVNWVQAADILPREKFILFKSGHPALGANLFRYRLMAAQSGIWLDTDMLLLRPIPNTGGELYGWQDDAQINNAVLYLPPGSPVLSDLLAFTRSEYPVPPFYDKAAQQQLVVARMSGKPVHVSQLPWGVWGPEALTHFVRKNGREEFARSPEVFYPVHHREAEILVAPGRDVEKRIRDTTLGIHLWKARLVGSPMSRAVALGRAIEVHQDSFFHRYCRDELDLTVPGLI